MKSTSFCLQLIISILSLSASASYDASSQLPACIGEHSKVLSLTNSQVLQLKQEKDARPVRALVAGKVSRVFQTTCNNKGTCHDHFEIQIGSDSKDILEVVYSNDFGALPKVQVGAEIQTCGDFINTSAQGRGRGPVSPSGAIIHWVHKSGCMDHENGYVAIDGKLFGFGDDRKARPCSPGVIPRDN